MEKRKVKIEAERKTEIEVKVERWYRVHRSLQKIKTRNNASTKNYFRTKEWSRDKMIMVMIQSAKESSPLSQSFKWSALRAVAITVQCHRRHQKDTS
jgi:hypothetical protein